LVCAAEIKYNYMYLIAPCNGHVLRKIATYIIQKSKSMV
jgi:hypothetical protein